MARMASFKEAFVKLVIIARQLPTNAYFVKGRAYPETRKVRIGLLCVIYEAPVIDLVDKKSRLVATRISVSIQQFLQVWLC